MRRFAPLIFAACGTSATAPSTPMPPVPKPPAPTLRIVDADGVPVAGALLTVTRGGHGDRLQTGPDGSFELASTDPVAVTATSPTGEAWAFERHFTPKPPAEIRLQRTGCEVFDGTLRGSALPQRFNIARVSEDEGDSFGVAVQSGGKFHACLPPGDYGGDPVPAYQSAQMFVRLPATIELPVAQRETYVQDATAIAGITGETIAEFVANLPPDAEVFGIAESNHGTREFNTERAMLTLELARTRGVRLAMMEAGFAEVIPLDDYINGAKVDVAKAVVALDYWIWNTHEFIDVLGQLRAANLKAPAKDRIHIAGFDMQDTHGGIPQLIAAHVIAPEMVPTLQKLVEKDGRAWKTMSEEERAPVIAALQAVADKRDNNGVASKTNRLALAAHQIVLRLHALEITDSLDKFANRDRAMAELALDIVSRGVTPRAVLWAHLGHLGRNYVLGESPMGGWLAKQLGTKYQVFAMLAASGSARGWDSATEKLAAPELPKPPVHSLEAMLGAHRVGAVSYFRFAAATPPARTWLDGAHPIRQFGVDLPAADQAFPPYVVPSLDGAIVIEDVHPTILMPTGER